MSHYLPPKSLTKSQGGEWAKIRTVNALDTKSHATINDNIVKGESQNILERYSFADSSLSSDSLCSYLTCEILLKRGSVQDPTRLFEVDVSAMGLENIETDLHNKFSSLRKITASDNAFSFDIFKHFSILSQLDLSLNQMSRLLPYSGGFKYLQNLNLSYNFLEPSDVEQLGYLPSLRILYLCGNDLRRLPPDFAESGITEEGDIIYKFEKLEVLHLDDNKLSDAQDFASLATLPRLKFLNLSNNKFHTVPLLKSTSQRKRQTVDTPKDSVTNDLSIHVNENSEMENQSVSCNLDCQNNEILVINGKNIKTTSSNKSDTVNSPNLHTKTDLNSANTEDIVVNEGKYASPNPPFPTQRKHSQKKHALDFSLLLDEHRNPSAPRIRIVDEFIGLSNLNKVFPSNQKKRIKYKQSIDKGNNSNGNTPSQSDQRVGFTAIHKTNSKNDRKCKENSQVLSNTEQTTDNNLSSVRQNSIVISNRMPQQPPPFQSLQFIDLSHNKISCEEHLLPVAVWPKLKEIIIYDNPVIKKTSKLPPLLERLLIKQLNINLRRNPIDDPSLFTFKDEGFNGDCELTTQLSLTHNQNVTNTEIVTATNNDSSKSTAFENNSRNKGILQKNRRRLPLQSSVKPVIVRHKLDRSSLNEGPKVIKFNVDKALNELRTANQKAALNQPNPVSNRSSHSSNLSSSSSSSSRHTTTDKALLPDIPHKIPQSLQLPPIKNSTLSVKSNSQEKINLSEIISSDLQWEEADEENFNTFFTTQLSSLEANTKQTSKHSSYRSDYDDELNPVYQQNCEDSLLSVNETAIVQLTEKDTAQEQQQKLIEYSLSPGPLLPDLEWLVDEDNLPDSMQACLRELRYLLQHKPTVHLTSDRSVNHQSSLLMLPENEQTIQHSTELISSPVVVEKEINKSENSSEPNSSASTTSSKQISPTSMELVPVSKTSEILPSKVNFNQLTKKYTNFIEIPLPKALDEEELQKQQLEEIRAKQNPLAKTRKWNQLKLGNCHSKRTENKGAKELFEQFQEIYSSVRVQAINGALETMNTDFEKKTEQFFERT
ncbi:unnamed protein product [Trichobilharzia szidati]|nr:unnamed protein product [Trichobilharzia szidati]